MTKKPFLLIETENVHTQAGGAPRSYCESDMKQLLTLDWGWDAPEILERAKNNPDTWYTLNSQQSFMYVEDEDYETTADESQLVSSQLLDLQRTMVNLKDAMEDFYTSIAIEVKAFSDTVEKIAKVLEELNENERPD